MKDVRFDARLAAARPDEYKTNTAFTDAVLHRLHTDEIISAQFRKKSVTKKETLFMRLRHLPVLAIIAVVVGVLGILTGTTYAVVKTIENYANLSVDEASKNEYGREQLRVTFKECELDQRHDTTYELKEGSELSAGDGAKALQAYCDMQKVDSWIRKELLPKDSFPVYLHDRADTVTAVSDTTITLASRGEKAFPSGATVISEGDQVGRETIQVGDTVFYYPDMLHSTERRGGSERVVVFKVSQPAKYYTLFVQSYINARGACLGNPDRRCLISNGINQTTLIVTSGDARQSLEGTDTTKQVQGKIVDVNSETVRVDVGGGAIFTIATPTSFIEQYNQKGVYRLGSFDGIYAKTAPEDLMIKVGDSLDIYYLEAADASATRLEWSQVLTVSLMVERIPNNLDVLRKY